ncbi:MAG: hypothetical protein AAB657_00875, partial [Patescibacteria group bacterium]
MKPEVFKNILIEVKNIGLCTVRLWKPEDGPKIYDQVEQHNWAPWLAAKPETLSKRAKVFPDGQLIIENIEDNKILATLSTNRFNWDGIPEHLPNWDTVAGKPPDYSNTYQPEGNTLDLVSMNVHPDYLGKGLPHLIIDQIKERAKVLEITHLIGDFRPYEFGKFKSEDNNWQISFEEYCNMTQDDGNLPYDAWLRNLVRNGMAPLKVDRQAMTVAVSLDKFDRYRLTYNPKK